MAGGRLTIDLDALAANYRTLAGMSAPAECAAVVKADAYGIGIEHTVPALAKAGCRTFFVALPAEGIAARKAAPDAEVYVLAGPLGGDAIRTFREHRLTPVLNSKHDIEVWREAGSLPAALHVDTGMNRLGVTPSEAAAFAAENVGARAIPLKLVMSHLACADDPGHTLNNQQLESFRRVTALFTGIDSSLANSAGIMLGGDFCRDLTRAGIALYGGRAANEGDNPMRAVVTVEARVLQVRQAAAGSTVGYGATAKLDRDTTLAIVATGYADGYHRAASGSGVPLRKAVTAGANGFVAGGRVPIVGRVSMDLTAFDVSECGKVSPGDWIELFGPNIPIDEVADAAGTIGYELLTGLGRRYQRVYVHG
ncbi:MAG: alanine racemase [Rhizobiaceae bacterium]|nr:alanine racemase [Rhizobiaceae bacterium]